MSTMCSLWEDCKYNTFTGGNCSYWKGPAEKCPKLNEALEAAEENECSIDVDDLCAILRALR